MGAQIPEQGSRHVRDAGKLDQYFFREALINFENADF